MVSRYQLVPPWAKTAGSASAGSPFGAAPAEGCSVPTSAAATQASAAAPATSLRRRGLMAQRDSKGNTLQFMRNQQRWDRLLLGVDSMPLATGINLVDVVGQYRIGDGSEIVRYGIATPFITPGSRIRRNSVIHISIHVDGRLRPFP